MQNGPVTEDQKGAWTFSCPAYSLYLKEMTTLTSEIVSLCLSLCLTGHHTNNEIILNFEWQCFILFHWIILNVWCQIVQCQIVCLKLLVPTFPVPNCPVPNCPTYICSFKGKYSMVMPVDVQCSWRVGQRQLAQCQVSVFYFHRRPWGPPSHLATGAWWQFAGFFLPGPGTWAVQPALGWLVESTTGPTLTCTHNRLPRWSCWQGSSSKWGWHQAQRVGWWLGWSCWSAAWLLHMLAWLAVGRMGSEWSATRARSLNIIHR